MAILGSVGSTFSSPWTYCPGWRLGLEYTFSVRLVPTPPPRHLIQFSVDTNPSLDGNGAPNVHPSSPIPISTKYTMTIFRLAPLDLPSEARDIPMLTTRSELSPPFPTVTGRGQPTNSIRIADVRIHGVPQLEESVTIIVETWTWFFVGL